MKKINTALLSFGMSGKVFHAPLIAANKNFMLAGAWERSTKLIQQQYSQTKSYNTLEEILNDDTIDLVIVNTPTVTHFEYASKVLKANKHAVVEKAFTTTVAEAEHLHQLAQQHNKVLSVFQNRRWDSDFRTVQKVIKSKVLGNINEAEIHFDRFRLKLSPKLHKEKPNAGAGILKDLGVHIIDQALCLFGIPQQVFADIRMARPNSEVDDDFEIILFYSTMRVRLKASYIVKEPLPAYIIHGTKGTFLKSRADIQETQLQKGFSPFAKNYGIEPIKEQGALIIDKKGETQRKKIKTLDGDYMQYYNSIYSAISKNITLAVTAIDGINTIKVIEAVIKSNDQKRVIDLN